MNKRNLHPKRALRSVLLVLLLSAVGMTKAFAANHDFTSVAANGQTLYYKITSNTTNSRTVMVTHPNSYNYSGTNSTSISYNYYNDPYGNGGTHNYYTKPTGNLIIPYYVEYNGISYSVTAIDEYAFGTTYSSSNACNGLTSLESMDMLKLAGLRPVL